MLSLMPLTCESDVPLTLFLTVSAYVPVLGYSESDAERAQASQLS